MDFKVIAFILNFILTCWPKTNLVSLESLWASVYVCVCVFMCVCVCVCVFLHDNSKRNRSRNMKFKFIVANDSDKFDIGHCWTQVKVTT